MIAFRNNSLILVSCAVIGLAVEVGGAAAHAQTMKQALELTYQNNPTLRASRAGLEARQELIEQARAGGRPKLNGVISYEYSKGTYDPGSDIDFSQIFGNQQTGLNEILDSLTGNAGFGSSNAGLEVTQPIFQGFRVKNSIREANARIAAAQSNLVSVEQQVFAAVIGTYFSVHSNIEAVRVAETRVTQLEEQSQAVQIMFDAGQATRTDMAQTKARLAGAEAGLIAARSDLAAAREQFETLVGQAPVNIDTEMTFPDIPETLEAALQIAMAHNPEIVELRQQEKASAQAVKVAKGYQAPSLSAKATAGYARDNFLQGDESSNFTLGAQLSIPIYQGGATSSAIRQAEHGHRADQFLTLNKERSVQEQVKTAWQRLAAAKAALSATSAQVEASALAFRGVKLEHEYGQRTILDVLDAEQAMSVARLDEIRAQQNYHLSAYALLQAMGRLTPEQLQLEIETP